MAWRFKVIHIPGKKHGGPDCLSRRGFGGPNGLAAALVNVMKPQEMVQIDEEHGDEMTTKDIRLNIFMALLEDVIVCRVETIDDTEYVMAAVSMGMRPIVMQDIIQESKKDKSITDTITIMDGVAPEGAITNETKELLNLANKLHTADGALFYRGRPLVPLALRDRALSNLHAAHQGVSRMCSRAEETVFWPGITMDIRNARNSCRSCEEYAPSQSNLPPVEPVVPEHPFQHVCADHLDFAGNSYGIIVDRFSNWLKLYGGQGGADTLVKVMRGLCNDFNIPEPVTTDGGPQYVAEETQKFFSQYGIKHRLVSVANPHANSRAEIGVKTAKRILRDNTGFNGSIDNVAMSRALMAYRNTPDPDTGLSPAELLIGRKLKEFLPNKRHVDPLSSSADLNAKWRRVAEWREESLSKTSVKDGEKWMRSTKDLAKLNIGQRVVV